MSFLHGLFGFMKRLIIFVLILAIAIPLRYGSTNYQYLTMRCLHSILSIKHSLFIDSTRPTLSADYRAFENLLRMEPLVIIDSSTDSAIILKELRSNFKLDIIVPKPSQCQINKQIFHHDEQSVDTYWIDHRQNSFEKNSDNILLYFHGGGYMLGGIHSYSGFVCHLSQVFNLTILFVEYRLSPEHQFPAAVNDTVVVYRALLHENISPSQLMIMGDSAGGGLSLLTIQALIAHQLPVPRGVVVLSPWADFSLSGESYIRNRHTDILCQRENIIWMVRQLLGENRSHLTSDNPMFCPLFGSFDEFPPMYITVGTAEIFEDDSKRVAQKAQDAGVDVTVEEGLHLMHVYPLFFSFYPEARNTLDNIKIWIQTIFTANDNE